MSRVSVLGLMVVCLGMGGCISSLVRSMDTLGRSAGTLLGEAEDGGRVMDGPEGVGGLRIVKEEVVGRPAPGGMEVAEAEAESGR